MKPENILFVYIDGIDHASCITNTYDLLLGECDSFSRKNQDPEESVGTHI